jgi:hypothetical protein
MGKVLCSTARRSTFALALAVGVAGAIALPASAASHGQPTKHHRTGHASTGTKVAGGSAVLGPAVKYVRTKNGTVRQVR